jgi:hypothetical protein
VVVALKLSLYVTKPYGMKAYRERYGGPYGYETSRLPHFLDNSLTDGGEVVSVTRRPSFATRNTSGSHFC